MRSSFLTTNSFSVIIREGHTSIASRETHSKSTLFSYIFIPGLVMLCSEKPPLLSYHPQISDPSPIVPKKKCRKIKISLNEICRMRPRLL